MEQEDVGRVRVLIVDDQPMFSHALTALLEADGRIEVVGATDNAVDAYELVEYERPHVVLMDLRLPGLDGIAATREIRASWPATRVVALSGLSDPADSAAALAAGASAFLVKGRLHEEIIDAIVEIGTVATAR